MSVTIADYNTEEGRNTSYFLPIDVQKYIRGMMQYLVENGVDMLYIQNNVIYKINKNN